MKTKVTRRIRDFVSEGGRYLGICAGAYFGSKEVRFDVGGPMEVKGDRDLVSVSLIPRVCRVLTFRPSIPGLVQARRFRIRLCG